MNIILDCDISDNQELRAALAPLLHRGSGLFTLDPLQGVNGTPNEKEGMVFITGLPSDVLRHHGMFFEKYRNAPQWFLILLNENGYGVILLKNAAIKYNLQNCQIQQADGYGELSSKIEQIRNSRKIVSGKVLVLSKHKKTSVQEFVSYLFAGQEDRCDIRTSANSGETDASLLLLCGHEAKDFEDVAIPEGMEPYYVLLNPEREVQQFIDPEQLVKRIAAACDKSEERVKSRLFFISPKAEQWKKMPSEGVSAVEQGILMWDDFGLPVPRRSYTAKEISGFLSDTYSDEKNLRNLIG